MKTPATGIVLLAAFGALIAGTAFAQTPVPPPPPPGAGAPPPPPPPPPGGPSVHVDRGPDRSLRFDLHCAESDTTRACTDIALELLNKLNADVQVK